MRPTVDLNVTGYRVLSREFSNDPTNIIERSRPEQRTDAILSAQQVVFDFGATARRAAAAGARLRAAGADLEASATVQTAHVAEAIGYRPRGVESAVTAAEVA